MIRRLIEDENIRLHQKKPDHHDFRLLAAGEISEPLFPVLQCKAKTGKDTIVPLLEVKTLFRIQKRNVLFRYILCFRTPGLFLYICRIRSPGLFLRLRRRIS